MHYEQQQQCLFPASRNMTDGALVEHILAGDERAFEDLLQRYQAGLFGFIYNYLRDEEQTKDVLQAVFLQLYLSLPRLHPMQPLRGWLFIVARNRCLDELRRKRRSPVTYFSELESIIEEEDISLLSIIPDMCDLPEEIAERHDGENMLQQAIAALPPKFHAVVVLHLLNQLSFSEIAQKLNMPEATAKTYWCSQQAENLADYTDSCVLFHALALVSSLFLYPRAPCRECNNGPCHALFVLYAHI